MLCQRCGKANPADKEKCRSCGAPLYVVGADRGGETSNMQPFLGVEDYLIDKLSTVEKQASRHSEDVDLLVHAVEFMERNVMVNRAGIHVLATMLREKGLIASREFDRRWRERALANLSALNRKERFLDVKPDVLAGFKGKNRRRFEERLTRAEDLLYGLQTRAAAQVLEEALALDPANRHLKGYLGEVFARLGDYPKAMACLTSLVSQKAAPTHVLLACAQAELRLGRGPSAEQRLVRLLDADPGQHEAWTLMALVHAMAGRWAACGSCADKALSLEETPAAYYLSAHALIRRGKASAAEARLEQLLSFSPDWEDPLLQSALLFLSRGWWARAAERLGRVEALMPGFDGAAYVNRFKAAGRSRRKAMALLPLDPQRLMDMMDPAAEEAGMYLRQLELED
jgi:tetratricopeptide (TPR) repeat protein